jgi:hypothetical protein
MDQIISDIEIYKSLSPMQKHYILNKEKIKENRLRYYHLHKEEINRRSKDARMRKKFLMEKLSGILADVEHG